jgi:hypothetical protein
MVNSDDDNDEWENETKDSEHDSSPRQRLLLKQRFEMHTCVFNKENALECSLLVERVLTLSLTL